MTDKAATLEFIAQSCEQYLSAPGRAPNELAISAVAKQLLHVLGFTNENIFPQFSCEGSDRADLAARFESLDGSELFNVSPRDPDLIVEVKRPKTRFSSTSKNTLEVVAQLERYLRSDSCKTARYGLIFNGCELQLFRKHAGLVYPITPILPLAAEQLQATVSQLERQIDPVHRPVGTIITVWNNKGGVGKTTTAQNLALLLSKEANGKGDRHRVLIIDFDHNQGDLTANFGLEPSDGNTYQLLESMLLDGLSNEQIASCVTHYQSPKGFRLPSLSLDVLRADRRLNTLTDDYLPTFSAKSPFPLRQLCKRLSALYDYVIIDAPPNHENNIFAREAVMAADCILPIAHFLELNSSRNYANLIVHRLEAARQERYDGGPYSLGLWYNRWKSTSAQQKVTRKSIEHLIDSADPAYQDELRRVFLDGNGGSVNLRHIDECSDIARSIMEARGIPGVLRFGRAKRAYANLLKTFLN